MKITQITVSYGETQSLPEYSNVKPNLTVTAVLDERDNPAAVEAMLWEQAKESVHAQIDAALEANDKAAKYSDEPRYQVMRTYWNQWDHRGEEKPPQFVVILPNDVSLKGVAYDQKLVHFGPGESRKLRYAHALRNAQQVLADKDEDSYTLLDCADGDLSRLAVALGVPESNPEVAPTADNPF